MQIRPATEADIPAIVGMSARFYPTTHYAEFAPFCPDSVAALCEQLIEGHVLLLAEVDGRVEGMAGSFCAPFFFNRAMTVGYEVVWWVNPEVRGGAIAVALLNANESACKAKGCARLQMVHMPNSPPQAAALYERMGYARSEISYTKELV